MHTSCHFVYNFIAVKNVLVTPYGWELHDLNEHLGHLHSSLATLMTP